MCYFSLEMETSIMITFLNLNSVLLLYSSKTIPLGWYSRQRLKPQKVTFWNIYYIPLDSTQLPNNLHLVEELKIKDSVSSQSCELHLFVIVISFHDYFTLWSNFSVVKKCSLVLWAAYFWPSYQIWTWLSRQQYQFIQVLKNCSHITSKYYFWQNFISLSF